jgi:hypothetical protein
MQEATMSDPQRLQHLAILAGPPKLNHDELLAAQKETLDRPRRAYVRAARLLFNALDTVYGRERTLGKFKVLGQIQGS